MSARILIIEDDALIRANLARLLRLEGYQVSLAQSGDEGAREALAAPPELIVCDLLMPGLDGYAVLAQLRTHAATQDIPFVLLTASAEKGEQTRSYRHGVTAFLSKPFDQRELLATIKACLQRD